jgi:hypothetical protein
MILVLTILALITALSGGYALLVAVTAIVDAIADDQQSLVRALPGTLAVLRRAAIAAVQCLCGFAFLTQLWI